VGVVVSVLGGETVPVPVGVGVAVGQVQTGVSVAVTVPGGKTVPVGVLVGLLHVGVVVPGAVGVLLWCSGSLSARTGALIAN